MVGGLLTQKMVRTVAKDEGNVTVKLRSRSSTSVADVCQQKIETLDASTAHTGEAPEKSLTANYKHKMNEQ